MVNISWLWEHFVLGTYSNIITKYVSIHFRNLSTYSIGKENWATLNGSNSLNSTPHLRLILSVPTPVATFWFFLHIQTRVLFWVWASNLFLFSNCVLSLFGHWFSAILWPCSLLLCLSHCPVLICATDQFYHSPCSLEMTCFLGAMFPAAQGISKHMFILLYSSPLLCPWVETFAWKKTLVKNRVTIYNTVL